MDQAVLPTCDCRADIEALRSNLQATEGEMGDRVDRMEMVLMK